MKSPEFHRYLRAALGPWFKSNGFKVAKRLQLGWIRPPLLIWIQIHPHGWDQYSGGRFFLNVQNGGGDGSWSGPTKRLMEFLTDDELEVMRDLQNRVVPKMRLPSREWIQTLRGVFTTDTELMIEAYLNTFKPDTATYRRTDDRAMRYRDADDVKQWGEFIVNILPRIVHDAATAGF